MIKSVVYINSFGIGERIEVFSFNENPPTLTGVIDYIGDKFGNAIGLEVLVNYLRGVMPIASVKSKRIGAFEYVHTFTPKYFEMPVKITNVKCEHIQ